MPGFVTLPEASWNRFSSCWATFRFRRLSGILAVDRGFGQQSMIGSVLTQVRGSRIRFK